MEYRHLRALMKRLAPPTKNHILKNCDLVIDGRSFFKDTYKKESGCHSLLGGEYDRYADYLKSLLKPFKDSNVTCYVVFNGGMEADFERKTEIHQKVIERVNNIDPTDVNAYCDPILTKDVWKEVLEELGIKYFVTEQDSWPTLFWVVKVFKCPILTKNCEYSLLNVDCIGPKSLVYKDGYIYCSLFENVNVCRKAGVKHVVLPLYYTLLNESSTYFKKLPLIIEGLRENDRDLASRILNWTRWRSHFKLEDTFNAIREKLTEEECVDFFNAYQKNEDLCKESRNHAAVKHFQQNKKIGNNKIAIPYVNLICNGHFSGSWVIFDKDQPDAMLAALDIIFYACTCLKFKKDAKIMFYGRQNLDSCVWEIENSCKQKPVQNNEKFKSFFHENMPGFDFKILNTIPEDCWILIMTLCYYYRSKIDIKFAYCMILSYVFMGPVSENVGVIKRLKFMIPETKDNDDEEDRNGLKRKDCVAVIDSMMDLFYVKDLKRNFDRQILHTFAEFQHCLQHMNYLNKLCDQKVRPTVFYKTVNATFAYNIYLKLNKVNKGVDKYIQKLLKDSSLFVCYKKIETAFKDCLVSIGIAIPSE